MRTEAHLARGRRTATGRKGVAAALLVLLAAAAWAIFARLDEAPPPFPKELESSPLLEDFAKVWNWSGKAVAGGSQQAEWSFRWDGQWTLEDGAHLAAQLGIGLEAADGQGEQQRQDAAASRNGAATADAGDFRNGAGEATADAGGSRNGAGAATADAGDSRHGADEATVDAGVAVSSNEAVPAASGGSYAGEKTDGGVAVKVWLHTGGGAGKGAADAVVLLHAAPGTAAEIIARRCAEIERVIGELGLSAKGSFALRGTPAAEGSAGQIARSAGARRVESYDDGNTRSVTYYSPKLQTYAESGAKRVNLQAAATGRGPGREERLVVGVPVITGDYSAAD